MVASRKVRATEVTPVLVRTLDIGLIIHVALRELAQPCDRKLVREVLSAQWGPAVPSTNETGTQVGHSLSGIAYCGGSLVTPGVSS
jgi:hypothetical protein